MAGWCFSGACWVGGWLVGVLVVLVGWVAGWCFSGACWVGGWLVF